MNPTLAQLAQQAGITVNAESAKFAQLIVQKCAGIYSKIDNGNLHMGTDNYLEALHKTFQS